MNKDELVAAHRDLVRDVEQYRRDHPWIPRRHPGGGDHAPAHVPGWVLPRLSEFAARLGYPVSLEHDLTATIGALGETRAKVSPDAYVPDNIGLQAGMTPASSARVLCHEIAHAQFHTACTDRTERLRTYIRRALGVEDRDLEEITAETTAALVSRALRINGGDDFSHWYLAAYTQRRPGLLTEVRDEAVRRALWTLREIA